MSMIVPAPPICLSISAVWASRRRSRRSGDGAEDEPSTTYAITQPMTVPRASRRVRALAVPHPRSRPAPGGEDDARAEVAPIERKANAHMRTE